MKVINLDKDDFKLYTTNNDYIIESWGASTKHPDAIHRFSKFEKSPCMTLEQNVYMWIVYLAAQQMFYYHATQYLELAQSFKDFFIDKIYPTNLD